MKKILNLIVGLCALGFANAAKAEVQIVESLMMFKVNGVDTYRQGDRADWGIFHNPRLSVDGLGVSSFDPSAGNSLVLDRIFVKSNHWNGGTAPWGGGTNDNWITAAPLFKYSISNHGGTDNWQTITTAYVSGGNVKEWNIAGLNRNLLSGLSAGSYTFKYYFDVEYNYYDSATLSSGVGHIYDASAIQAGGPNFANASSTSFTVIPEPSSSLLMGLGLAGLVALRLRRHRA